MFKRVNGEDLYSGAFRAHSMRVLGGLNMVISAIDNDDIAKFVLSHLHEDHVDRHVPGNYYQVSPIRLRDQFKFGNEMLIP